MIMVWSGVLVHLFVNPLIVDSILLLYFIVDRRTFRSSHVALDYYSLLHWSLLLFIGVAGSFACLIQWLTH